MRRFGRMAAAVGAVALLGVGAGATGASAYSISGGSYTGSPTADHTTTFAAVHTVVCGGGSYTGVATGSDTTSFTADLGFNCDYFGFPAYSVTSGDWNLKVVAGPDINGYYEGELSIPSGTTTIQDIPSVGSCTVTIAGPQTFRHGFSSTVIRMKNESWGVTLEMDLNGMAYAATGSCFPSGSGGLYSTNGTVEIPGIVIS